jgi:hypothetical protein
MKMSPFPPVLLQSYQVLPSTDPMASALVWVLEFQGIASAAWMPAMQALMESDLI